MSLKQLQVLCSWTNPCIYLFLQLCFDEQIVLGIAKQNQCSESTDDMYDKCGRMQILLRCDRVQSIGHLKGPGAQCSLLPHLTSQALEEDKTVRSLNQG